MRASPYKIIEQDVSSLRQNLNNPRTISEDNFRRLVKSIKDAPWMLKLRPIVIDEFDVILGGNQRFNASVEAGLSKVWVIRANDLTEEQRKRFILRDNIDFGKWDLEIIRQQYTQEELIEYGSLLDLLPREAPQPDEGVKPPMGDDYVQEPNIDDGELAESQKNFNDNSIKQIVFVFEGGLYEDTLRTMDEISKTVNLDDNSEVLIHLLNFYEESFGITDG